MDSAEASLTSVKITNVSTTSVSTVTPPPPPPAHYTKIWIWSVAGTCIVLLIISAIFCLLLKCWKRSERDERKNTDAELPIKELDTSEIPARIAALHTCRSPNDLREEEGPLLEKENKDDQTEKDTTVIAGSPHPSLKESTRETEVSLRSNETNADIRALDHSPMSRSTTYEIPAWKISLKNQLSLEANSPLRHIDSSSEESFNQTTTTIRNSNTYHEKKAKHYFSISLPEIVEQESKVNISLGFLGESEEKIDMKRYYLRRKVSKPPKEMLVTEAKEPSSIAINKKIHQSSAKPDTLMVLSTARPFEKNIMECEEKYSQKQKNANSNEIQLSEKTENNDPNTDLEAKSNENSTRVAQSFPSLEDISADQFIKLNGDKFENQISNIDDNDEQLSTNWDLVWETVQYQEALLMGKSQTSEVTNVKQEKDKITTIENLKAILNSEDFLAKNQNNDSNCMEKIIDFSDPFNDDFFDEDDTSYEIYHPKDDEDDSLSKNLDFAYFNRQVNSNCSLKDGTLDPIREESISELEEYERENGRLCQL